MREEERRGKTSILTISEPHLRQFRSPLSKSASFSNLLSQPPVLSIAVLYFYMSFACSSSNLAPSIFFFFFPSPSFSCVSEVCADIHVPTQEHRFSLPSQKPMCVLCGRYLFHVNRIYSGGGKKASCVSCLKKKKVVCELKCVCVAV